MKRHPGAVARRYACALYAAATTEGEDRTRKLKGELDALAALLEKHPTLAATLSHPALHSDARAGVLGAVVDRAGGSVLIRRLVDVLARRDRIEILGALALAYGEELNAAEGTLAATAVTAVPLAESQRETLAAALADVVGGRVALANDVDAAVIGGVLLHAGGRSYDGTVRTQLRTLRDRLAAGR